VFCLKWPNHNSNMRAVLCSLLRETAFCDITLVAEGQPIQAHKLVLIACSEYFKVLLTPLKEGQHPLIILEGVNFAELKALLDYMYYGEVSVSKSDLPSLIKSSKTLKVKSLGEVSDQLARLNENTKSEKIQADHIAPADSYSLELDDGDTSDVRNENKEEVQDSFIFEEHDDDDIDEEEKILYLDQNNEIITRHDQPLDNSAEETAISIADDRRGETLITNSLSPLQNKVLESIRASQRQTNNVEDTREGSLLTGVVTSAVETAQEKRKTELAVELDDLQSQEPLSPAKIFSASGPQYRKKQSKVWTHFEKSSDGAHVICNSCGEVQRFMSNTTNMIRHIQKVHSNKAKSDYNEPTRRMKQLRRKVCQRSPVWSYFHRLAHLNKVQCKLCLENYSYSGNTTNLRFHMRTRHPEVYSNIDEEQAINKGRKVLEKAGVVMECPLKSVNIDLVIDEPHDKKSETISVEVCNLESGDLGGPMYVAAGPASGYLL